MVCHTAANVGKAHNQSWMYSPNPTGYRRRAARTRTIRVKGVDQAWSFSTEIAHRIAVERLHPVRALAPGQTRSLIRSGSAGLSRRACQSRGGHVKAAYQ